MASRSSAEHATYCRQMAMQTYALADATEDLSMIRAYVDVAARWLRLAAGDELKPNEFGVRSR